MNKNKLRDICLNISEETGLSFNSIQTHYFLESILKRIGESDERENFIFKGGFLLSNVIGIGSRSTVDIDFSIKNFSLTEENIKQKFEKILEANSNSEIIYKIKNIEKIKDQDEYGGFRIKILCKLDNIELTVPLDIATGDPITGGEIVYEYKSIFSDESINICAYNIESILAEKLHTIYSLGSYTSRSKDFYDVYALYKYEEANIDFKKLSQACINTFKYRQTIYSPSEIINTFELIITDEQVKKRWDNYQRKNAYAQGIAFDDIIDQAIELVKKMERN